MICKRKLDLFIQCALVNFNINFMKFDMLTEFCVCVKVEIR